MWADGSLMIDTFRRAGFTSDTNAIFIYLLNEFGRGEIVAMGDNEDQNVEGVGFVIVGVKFVS